MTTVRAGVRFLPPEEGGRLEPARDGIRPQLKLGDIQTSCVVRSTTGATTFDAGVLYDVDLELVFWDQVVEWLNGDLSALRADAPVELFDGSRLIAVGAVVAPAR